MASPPHTSLSLQCSPQHKPQQLVLVFNGTALPQPLHDLRFYMNTLQQPASLVAAWYADQVVTSNVFQVQMGEDLHTAQLALPAAAFGQGAQQFRHYALYSTSADSSSTHSTAEVDEPFWGQQLTCSSSVLPSKTAPPVSPSPSPASSSAPAPTHTHKRFRPFSSKTGLLVGVGSALGSLAIMLAILLCCCLRRRRRRQLAKEQDKRRYHQLYGTQPGPYGEEEEFIVHSNSRPPQGGSANRKVSATSQYLRKYYNNLKAVRESPGGGGSSSSHSNSDGEAEHVGEEIVV